MSHCVIFDIGKTNKKLFVFDEAYRIVYEKNTVLPETTDEDGFPCEDLHLLKNWVVDSLQDILKAGGLIIKAANCTAYGASFVHLDEFNEPITPLYNYLKPYPKAIAQHFFDIYGSEEKIALETASPVLGHLNSGLQLYRLKQHNALIFNKIKWSLHLPQYIAHLISSAIFNTQNLSKKYNEIASDITSIGCHTMLWDFRKNSYHEWVVAEKINEKFPAIMSSETYTSGQESSDLKTGIGLHDSSAALIPYLATFKEPFVLISTGTWCISMNPFNDEPLNAEELSKDCLCYLSFKGKPVKAARYFGGNEHEQAVEKMAMAFGVDANFYRYIQVTDGVELWECYVAFMRQLVDKQVVSTRLAIGGSPVQQLFVDGGFSKNQIFMTLLAEAFPGMKVFASEVAQASAIGAALVIHEAWNDQTLPSTLIELKNYSVQ